MAQTIKIVLPDEFDETRMAALLDPSDYEDATAGTDNLKGGKNND